MIEINDEIISVGDDEVRVETFLFWSTFLSTKNCIFDQNVNFCHNFDVCKNFINLTKISIFDRNMLEKLF